MQEAEKGGEQGVPLFLNLNIKPLFLYIVQYQIFTKWKQY